MLLLLFYSQKPLLLVSVSPLVAAAGGSHLALPNATARGTYPKHVREVISSTSLYNQTQSDEKKVGKVVQI